MVASDRQVMYWAPGKKTVVALKCLSTHSAVGQSFTIRYCTGRSGTPLIGTCHISASVTKQVCCKCSCPGGPVCYKRRSQSFLWPFALKCLSTYSILHRPQSVRFLLVHAISQLLLQYNSKPLNFLGYFGFNFRFFWKELLLCEDYN